MKSLTYMFIFILIVACNNSEKVITPLSKVKDGNFKEIILKDNVVRLSCESLHPVVINVPTDTLVMANEVFESYWYIPLETIDNSLVGNIDKICFDDGYIFVFDGDNDKVLQFTDLGKFVRQVGSLGRGPHEYLEVWSIDVDKVKKQICLLDLRGRKLLYFNYDGHCVKEEPLYFLFTDFAYYNDLRYIYTGKSYNKNVPSVYLNELTVADSTQRPLFCGFPITEKIRDNFTYSPLRPINKFEDGIFYKELLSDTIWKVEREACKAVFVLNFSERGELFTVADRENITDDLYVKKKKNGRYGWDVFLMTRDYAIFTIAEKTQVNTLLYSKKTGKIVYGAMADSYNTTRMGDKFVTTTPSYVQNDDLVYILQPYNVKKYADSWSESQYESLCDEDKSLLNSLDVEDNPVLMIAKVKEF